VALASPPYATRRPNGHSSSSGLVCCQTNSHLVSIKAAWTAPTSLAARPFARQFRIMSTSDSSKVTFSKRQLLGTRNGNFRRGDQGPRCAVSEPQRLRSQRCKPEMPASGGRNRQVSRLRENGDWMVGATGIEPVTPSMSRRCSSAELRAQFRDHLSAPAGQGKLPFRPLHPAKAGMPGPSKEHFKDRIPACAGMYGDSVPSTALMPPEASAPRRPVHAGGSASTAPWPAWAHWNRR
jgi:hypothetical protein